MERIYNKPALVEYDGVLQKNGNRRPTCDQAFLDWCKENSIRFGSYEDMGKKLGMDGSCFKRLMNDYHMELVFDPKARMTPKLYKDRKWLYHEVIELNKKAGQIAEENGWTPRVVEKWMGVLKINNHTYKQMKKLSNKQKELIRCYRFNTKIIDELKEIRNEPISSLISSLNNFGLSIWLLDDGYRGPYWELCVASYTENEKELMLDKLFAMGFPSAHLSNHDPRYLRFNAEDSRGLDKIILTEIPNDLDIIKYKIIKNDKIRPERGTQN